MWITVFAVTTAMSLSCIVLAILNEHREGGSTVERYE
jgi:hypothetical protein